MNTSIRSTLSTSTALGLVSFIVVSAVTSGVAAPVTLVGFGLLAAYGLLEIAIVSYRTPRLISTKSVATRPIRPVAPAASVVSFPVAGREESARAA